MRDFEDATYGDHVADIYDGLYPRMLDIDGTLQRLQELARPPARVLELGVGTGRVAIPLARKGLEVHGIDASEAMVAKLREKEGGDAVRVTIGNMADVAVEQTFSLIFLVFNTLFALRSQAEQLRCFENVARRLDDDGVFLIECFVPDLSRFDRDQRVNVIEIDMDKVMLDTALHNVAEQRIDVAHVIMTEKGNRIIPIQLRYAYPSELDLMASAAGLKVRDRWGGWRREPFDSQSQMHVTVYEKA